MNEKTPEPAAPGPGIHNLTLAKYHAAPGVSKSMLDYVPIAPALIEWSRKAPVDPEAKAAVSIGQAFHTFLLQPELFDQQYVVEFQPPLGALSTVADLKGALDKAGVTYKANAAKGDLVKLLLDHDPNAPVSEAMFEEWQKGVNGRAVLSVAEGKKLILMRDSLMAHPTARRLIETPGPIEQSHFWIDRLTGELCRVRPDKSIPSLGFLVDVKTAADVEDRAWRRSMLEYRYHVQDAFYSDGYERTAEKPKAFLFLIVSTTRDRARYPVHVRALPPEQANIGRDAYKQDLATYAHCKKTGVWSGVEETGLPEWFVAQQLENGIIV